MAETFTIIPLSDQWTVKENGVRYAKTAVGFFEVDQDGFIYAPWVQLCNGLDDALAAVDKEYDQRVRQLLRPV